MKCRPSSLLSFDTTPNLQQYFESYSMIIAFINITGNSLLIWGVQKTGQTRTISFQFIIMMSVSDLVLSTVNVIYKILNAIYRDRNNCWMILCFQFLLSTCSMFSFIMVALIAFDRFLHMRYLERYSSIVTKKRGYLLAIASCFFSSAENIILVLSISYKDSYIGQAIYLFLALPVMVLIFIFYYSAMKAIRAKASQISRNIITQTRALSRAATRITICLIVLSLPLLIIQVLELVNRSSRFTNPSLLGNAKFIAYATFTSNAFWSAYIFISLNRPIRMLLWRPFRNCKRRSVGGLTERTVDCATTAAEII